MRGGHFPAAWTKNLLGFRTTGKLSAGSECPTPSIGGYIVDVQFRLLYSEHGLTATSLDSEHLRLIDVGPTLVL